MRVVVTEAASSVAYYLLPMIASGEVLQSTEISELVLCDRSDNWDAMCGVAMELQDCMFPQLLAVSTTCDFCQAFSTADVVVVLPGNGGSSGTLQLSDSVLEERDFASLDGALHKTGGLITQDTYTIKARGPLSKAKAISEHISAAYGNLLQGRQLAGTDMPSSVQLFGIPTVNENSQLPVLLTSLFHQETQNSQAVFEHVKKHTQNSVLLVNVTEKKAYNKQLTTPKSQEYFARL